MGGGGRGDEWRTGYDASALSDDGWTTKISSETILSSSFWPPLLIIAREIYCAHVWWATLLLGGSLDPPTVAIKPASELISYISVRKIIIGMLRCERKLDLLRRDFMIRYINIRSTEASASKLKLQLYLLVILKIGNFVSVLSHYYLFFQFSHPVFIHACHPAFHTVYRQNLAYITWEPWSWHLSRVPRFFIYHNLCR